jgi:ubiquinone/menaquinone biosynthesis C-methylase UbiE
MFDNYFNIFPWERLTENAVGFDLGCGSGRWAKLVAPRVGRLIVMDPSADALAVARRNLADADNCAFHNAGVDDMPIADESFDFGYSLGVLHHIPNTEAGLQKCVKKLKSGAPFLVYLYYNFDNRPAWFRLIWRTSELIRTIVSKMPNGLRYVFSQIFAVLLYWPLARFAWLAEKTGVNVANFPLSQYRDNSFYVMRNDALDRFGTSLERRFSKAEIEAMMRRCGLDEITFSKTSFWTAVGFKK